ncbi:MAG: hypothetical protein CVT92_00990 [Bacteroidetes bacterium HGW-Bacteroidetes-1]|jgi:hypothetical protein|nr:MAG: hypothetical protein CVT92_00990 [Bacteroidetes bacterium HGW-Bacteroidetes-1]
MKLFFTIIFFLAFFNESFGQCCAIGGGSPLAGDVSQGVLKDKQFEISSNYQFTHSTNFLTERTRDTNFLEKFSSQYLYSRIAFGLSERLTMSIELGYWLEKNQVGLVGRDSYLSKGISDLILFPRYNIIKSGAQNKFTELTFGMGFKIPLGSFNDSIGMIEPFSGETLYSTKPPAVQATSGAHDLIFRLFYSGGIPSSRFKLSANAVYILKGWNPLGEKLGNYASFGIFIGRTFFEKMNAVIQIKSEWIDKMRINSDLMMVSFPNYDPEATGSKKIFIAPQLSYLLQNRFTFFLQSEFPIYQQVNKTQIASQTQFTIGLTYRFMAKNSGIINPTIVIPPGS